MLYVQVMTLFAEAHNFEHELLVTLPRLVTDQHPKVRRTVASGFYEVCYQVNIQIDEYV